jgi:hypothetical protein
LYRTKQKPRNGTAATRVGRPFLGLEQLDKKQ